MNPFEEKLKQFVEDEVMFEAIRSHLLSYCDLNVLFSRTDLLQAEILEKGRGWQQARELIDKGFGDLRKYRRGKGVEKKEVNPAV